MSKNESTVRVTLGLRRFDEVRPFDLWESSVGDTVTEKDISGDENQNAERRSAPRLYSLVPVP
jgi:hypothetical protein